MHLLLALTIIGAVAALPDRQNLAYVSPSVNHPHLAIPPTRLLRRFADGVENSTERGYPVFKGHEVSFTHGIASGDPGPTSVILWTRLSPVFNVTKVQPTVQSVPIHKKNQTRPHFQRSACVQYRVALDYEFQHVVDAGQVYTTAEVDYIVKIEARNLKPYTRYHYKFQCCHSNNISPVGLTKTLPPENEEHSGNITVAVYASSVMETGYFNAYSHPVREDTADYVLHLGNYITATRVQDPLEGRVPQPDQELWTLDDYRGRYASYRTDKQLLSSHANFPWINIWDDGEIARHAWQNGSRDASGTVYQKRKLAAIRAFYEWLPIRQVDMDNDLRIWRRFTIGKTLDLILLDARLYERSPPVSTNLWGKWNKKENHNQTKYTLERSILGQKQEQWLYDELDRSVERNSTWRLIGNQVQFTKYRKFWGKNGGYDLDAWEGFVASRNRLLAHIWDNNVSNIVFLSGNTRTASAWDVTWERAESRRQGLIYNKMLGRGSLGVEFTVTAVSASRPFPIPRLLCNLLSGCLLRQNSAMEYQDLYYRGYTEVLLNRHLMEASFFGTIHTDKVDDKKERRLVTLTVRSGENRLARGPGEHEIGKMKPNGGKLRGQFWPLR